MYKFRKTLWDTEITETVKSLETVSYIERYFQSLDENASFGVWYKQAGDSIHSEVLIFWNKRENDMMKILYILND